LGVSLAIKLECASKYVGSGHNYHRHRDCRKRIFCTEHDDDDDGDGDGDDDDDDLYYILPFGAIRRGNRKILWCHIFPLNHTKGAVDLQNCRVTEKRRVLLGKNMFLLKTCFFVSHRFSFAPSFPLNPYEERSAITLPHPSSNGRAVQSYLPMSDFTQGMEFAQLDNVLNYRPSPRAAHGGT